MTLGTSPPSKRFWGILERLGGGLPKSPIFTSNWEVVVDSDRLSTESRTALCRLLRPPYLDWNEISEFASVIPGLVDRGYVERKSYTINHSGCDPVPGVLPLTLTLFAITEKGRVVLNRELRETVLELQQRSE